MRRELEHIEIPGEHDARERAWRVVAAALAEREPLPRRSPRRLVPALAVAAIAAVVAATAATSPGRALVHSLRETIGVRNARPALFSLPAPGRLLVTSGTGVWVVEADGERRLLAGYRDASWSPHGLFVAATRPNELVALTPVGAVRWSLARPQVRFPRWTGTRTDTRIAYLSTSRLHVVGGDGRGDVDAGGIAGGSSAAARLAPAWRPGKRRVVSFVTTRGRVVTVAVDAGADFWSHPPVRSAPFAGATQLEWSSDGKRLLLVTRDKLVLFGTRSAKPLSIRVQHVEAAAFRPGSHQIAVLRRVGADSRVVVGTRVVFSTTARLAGLTWSPDGRWLLVGSPDADQWVFVDTTAGAIHAVSGISQQFRSREFPQVDGWTPK